MSAINSLLRQSLSRQFSTKMPMAAGNAQLRPMSPHLEIYKLPVPATASIIFRITGGGLTGGIYGASMAYALSPISSASVVSTLASYPALLLSLKALVTIPLTFHTFHGLRHLMWDAGYGLELKSVRIGSWVVGGLTVVSSAALCSM